MASGYPPHEKSFEDVVAQCKAAAKLLTVAELKNVLKSEGLHVSGVKAGLQMRIIAHIEQANHDRNRMTLDRINKRLLPGNSGLPNYPKPNSTAYFSPFSPIPTSSLSPFAPTPSRPLPTTNGFNMPPHRNPFLQQKITVPDSPFYNIRYQISEVTECRARESTRDICRIRLSLTQNNINDLQHDNAKIMVFCAADGTPNEIAFPHQVELKVNDTEVKANLRGLKNRPGSTRPADITSLVRRKTPGLPNTVEVTYALTNKGKPLAQKFWLVVSLVHMKPVESLVQELRRGKSISKEQVLRELQNQADDMDIVATSSVMSLKCPLGFTRITTPCRGVLCKHNQCFDATAYLQLQEQAPQWTCPVCNKTASWEGLVLDRYMEEILECTPKSTEEVTIEPDGRWHLGKGADSSVVNSNMNSNPTPSDDGDGDSDDALEIIENPTTQSIKRDWSFALTPSSVKTPPLNSPGAFRAASNTPGPASWGTKRGRSEVIDLTISDDDDDEPVVKRQRPSMSSSTNSFLSRPSDQNTIGTPTFGNGFHFTMPLPNPPPPPPIFNYYDRFGNGSPYEWQNRDIS